MAEGSLDVAAFTFTVPANVIGFVGSPGEFTRAEKSIASASMRSTQMLPVGEPGRELRLFTVPEGVALRTDLDRVPGFNIRILHAGDQIVVRAQTSEGQPS